MKILIQTLLFIVLFVGKAEASNIINLLSRGVGKRVDFVTYWRYYPPDFQNPNMYRKLKDNFDIAFSNNLYAYTKDFDKDDPNLQKIIFLDWCGDPRLTNLPKGKLVCFIFEPHMMSRTCKLYDCYDRIYTFDDNLIDNKKFFKFHYPVLLPLVSDIPSFEEKKLCIMINSRWIPERVKILEFFSTQPKDYFHAYGSRFKELVPQFCEHPMIKGKIAGAVSSQAKLDTLKKYRFCICFENKHTIAGYVTEKIFDVFAGGCVPIYWGPNNIEKFVPADCFIDYRKFKNNDEMLEFMLSMKEEEYNQYLANIKAFLESDQAKLFSVEAFEDTLYEALTY